MVRMLTTGSNLTTGPNGPQPLFVNQIQLDTLAFEQLLVVVGDT
ncbi:Uncharacterised protein [Serratia fonticola]|uniref:Uncharacterized protein n=1 Tax=Serratia fonticola TaxID=47917 RepID=A0A4U9WJG0_SERFO|nr:Uncharacterised protein [Serratia fonticola]